MEGQPEEGKGKITIPWKWRDEEGEDIIDLSDPNDIEKLSRKWNQAHGYEKGQSDLKAVKGDFDKVNEQVEYWNGLIEDAKETGDNSRVEAALEMSGVKMGKSDPAEPLDDSDKKFNELGKEVERLKVALYSKYTNDTHSQLEAKFSDGNYPEYKQKEVEDFANKKGIRDFEDAYWIMNKDEIVKVQAKEDKDKGKKHADKIKKVASVDPGSGNIPAVPVEKHTDYGKATENWTKDPNITENLFDDS